MTDCMRHSKALAKLISETDPSTVMMLKIKYSISHGLTRLLDRTIRDPVYLKNRQDMDEEAREDIEFEIIRTMLESDTHAVGELLMVYESTVRDKQTELSCLPFVVKYGTIPMLRHLYQNGFLVHTRSVYCPRSFIHTAAFHRRGDIVEFLVNEANFHADGPPEFRDDSLSPLCYLTSGKNCEQTVSLLLDKGADPSDWAILNSTLR